MPKIYKFDPWLAVTVALFLVISLLMVTSSSIAVAESHNVEIYYYAKRQGIYIGAGLFLAYLVYRFVSVKLLYQLTPWLGAITILLLIAVLTPLGSEVNGAKRWIPLGGVNAQPAELAKLASLLYIASYLRRQKDRLANSFAPIIIPLLVLGVVGLLLLLEPDFGSTVVIFTIGLGMLFMAGVSLWRFSLFGLLVVGGMGAILLSSSYRVARLMIYRTPWDDPYNQGFQLTNSLMAIGNGKLAGVGLGESNQKLGYLPEAHTDFIFSIFAEEFGFFGVLFLILLYLIFIWRSFNISARALRLKSYFSSHIARGVGLWFAVQAFIHMGVTMGLLPTKGLTLPLISYGGSSVVIMLVTVGILFRIDRDVRILERTQWELYQKRALLQERRAKGRLSGVGV